MCVIIYIPQGAEISEEEINAAWRRNSHGAGFMYRDGDNKIHYHRGFMELEEYKEAIKPLNGNYELVLHLRISTSDKVNRVQTHPYELGDVTNQKGVTTQPVICMNGSVKAPDLVMLDECNDTMSYIVENNELFSEFINNEITKNDKIKIIDFIKEETTAKWCIMTPEGTFFTKGFTKSKGLSFSNLIHRTYMVNTFSTVSQSYKDLDMKDIIKSRRLRKQLYVHDIDLYYDIYDYIDEYCCLCPTVDCVGCLKQCKNIKDIKLFQENNKEKIEELTIYYPNDDYNIEYTEDYYDYSKWDDNYCIFDE